MAEPSSSDVWEDDVMAVWGLEDSPFTDIAKDSFFFPSTQHLRVLDFMRRVLCSQAPAGVITGAPGVGKRLLARQFCTGLDNRILLSHIERSDWTGRDFLLEVLRQFGVQLGENDRTDCRLLLQRYLVHQVSNGRICLLIVSNAHALTPGVLDELLHLASMSVEGSRLIKLILLGQPLLNHVVDSPRLRGLVPDAVPRVVLSGLSEDQLAAYVAHRLRAAGSKDPDQLFAPALTPLLHRLTDGIPAAINALCGRALAVAAVEGEAVVSAHSLSSAALQLGYSVDATEQPEPVVEPAAGVTLLRTMRGGADQVIEVNQSRLLIGRSELADVCIDSAFVSRYHALIVREPGQDVLVDLGSTNGVLVNARRIHRQSLRHRDLIQIGSEKLTYLNPQQTPATVTETGQTMSFARLNVPANEHTVFAFGRFEDAS